MSIVAQSLCFSYNGKAILKEMALEIGPGELVAILGPNGVGKTTLLKCLNIMHRPTGGAIMVEGRDALRMRPAEIAMCIGYVAQQSEPARLTVFDAVLMGRKPHIRWRPVARDLKIVESAIRRLHLEELALRRIDQLSGGELQKVCIARALVQEPRFLLLDEPTSALDLKNQVEIMRLLRSVVDEHDIGGAMTMHDLNRAMRYADSVVMMKDGKVYAHCKTTEVSARTIEEVYGLAVEIHRIHGYPMVVPLESGEVAAVPS